MKNLTRIIYPVLLFFCLLVVNSAFAQSVIVTGSVKDINDEPLIGVNIVEIDENGRYLTGTVTDFNGNFTFKASSKEAELQISFIGYKMQMVTVGNKTKFDIVLEEESTGLGEVVITGEKMGNDGVIAIRDRGTAISRLEFEDLQVAQTTTVEEMLQGRISNVDITAVSGDPGAGLNIRIRGTATLNANNEPLIVVNGIPYNSAIASGFDFASADIEKFGNLIDVSPEDIESIEVLKDAASTAIYGSKASNGVLMIKTKRGKKSKPLFEYTSKITRSQEPDPIPMLDGAGYARLIKEAHFNNDAGTWFDENDTYEIDFDPTWENYHNFNQNTNWVEEITQIGYVIDQNFSVRGGGEKSRYKMSFGYTDEQGTTIETGLTKLNISTSLDYEISSKLKFRTDIMFTRYDQLSNAGDVRGIAYRKMPNMSVYERDTLGNVLDSYFTPIETIQGQGSSMYNPVAYARLASSKSLRDNTRAAFGLRYTILPNLYYDGTITFDIFDGKTFSFIPFEAIGYLYNSSTTNRSTESYSKTARINTNQKVVYTPNLGDEHELVFLALLETESSNARGFSKQTSLSASPYLTDAAESVKLNYFGSTSSKSRSIGTYVSANYKFKDKYLISAGVRYEGSSNLSKESRWGFFPMTTLAWRISEEPFLKGLRFIDDLKIRGSWGLSGNMPRGDYLYFNTYSASTRYGYMGVSGVRPDGIELTSLRWETIEQFSPGITFFGLKNRLNIEFDIYQKLTHDLYLPNSRIPTTAGFTSINQNGGEMVNRGWELMIDATVVQSKDWKINFNFNTSSNQNIVLSLPENIALETYNLEDNGVYGNKIQPGVPLGNFYGYEYAGVYVDADDVIVQDKNGNPVYGIDGNEPLIMQHASGYEFEAGDAKYVDQNHDGIIDELDVVLLGDYNPELMGGIGPRVQYKNVTVNFFLYYRLGQDIINGTRIDTENMRGHDNQSKATNRRWRSPGDITDMPRALYGKGYNYLGSSRFVEDASFMRLKTASISYNFPKKLCKKINVRDIRLYTTAYNLFTWTTYSGQDPEVGFGSPINIPTDRSRTPPGKRITLGLNIKF